MSYTFIPKSYAMKDLYLLSKLKALGLSARK